MWYCDTFIALHANEKPEGTNPQCNHFLRIKIFGISQVWRPYFETEKSSEAAARGKFITSQHRTWAPGKTQSKFSWKETDKYTFCLALATKKETQQETLSALATSIWGVKSRQIMQMLEKLGKSVASLKLRILRSIHVKVCLQERRSCEAAPRRFCKVVLTSCNTREEWP